MACNIIRGLDGTNTVVDANGNPSALYDDLLELLSNYPYVTSELIPTDDINNLALQYYELSNTPEFRSKYNLTSKLDVEVSIDNIINHINTEYSFNETQEVKEGVKDLFESNPELANAVYEALGFETPTTKLEGRKYIDNKVVNFDVIEELASAERSDIPSSILIKKLLNEGYLPKINETGIVLGGLEYGIWRPNLKKIEAQGENKSTLAKKIGHELLHSVTHNIIYSYQNLKGIVDFNDKYNKHNIRQGYIKPVNLSKSQIEALDNLVRIRNKVVSYIEQNKDRIQKQDRGFGTYDYFIKTNYTESETDLHEFISEVFTNPELINILKEIPTEGKKSNLFKDFIDSIAKILGFTNTSILEDIIAYSEEAFFTQSQITQQQKQEAQQLYSQYLDTIFPDSKVKDILKHTTSATVDTFKKGTGRLGEGIYFAAPDYKMYDKAGINVYRVIVNINNLKRYDKGDFVGVSNDLFSSEDEYSSAPQKSLQAQDKLEGIDGYVSTAKTGTEYNIFEPEQIHILGSNNDIQGFKEFVSSNVIPEVETVNNFGVNTKIDIPVVDKLSDNDKRNELDILLNAINKLKRDKVYSEKTINTITRMMRDIGFNMGSFEEIVAKSKRPYLKKENAIVDITAKMIHISEGGSVSDLLEEIGHIISAQLDGAEFEKALEIIKNEPKYTNEMQKYIAIYQSEEQYTGEDAINKAATEVLGHLIGEQLGNKLEENTDETLVGFIKNFIKRILGMFRNQFDLHKYVSQSVDYFIQTPNRPFKRETYYYSLNVNKKNYERLLYNLKQQLNKLTDLKSKYDENKTEPKLFKSSSNYNRLANLKKQISSIANEWIDVKTDKNLLDFLDSMLYDTNEVVDWIKKYIDVADSDVVITLSDGTEETLKTYITLGFKDDFNISDVSLSALSQARDYVNNYNSVILILNNIIDNNTRLSQEVKLDLKKYVGNLRDRLAFIENSVKEINELKTQEVIKKLVEETGVTYDYDSLPDTVRNAMESYESTTDLNTAEVWFGPMGMVNSSISRLVDGTFNLLYNNARIKTIDFSNSFLDKFKSYIGRNMSFVAEKYNGKTTGDFIDEYYWGQWNIERVKFMKELNTSKEFNFPIDAYLRGEEFDDIKLFNKERKELDDRLEKLNDDLLGTMLNSQEYNELKEIIDNLSIKIEVFEEKADMLDNYLNKINSWYKSNAKQRHNVDDIINHYKTILSDDDFNIWYDRNVVTNSKNKVLFYKGELSQPSDKWKNKDFNKLTNEQKRILSELKTYKKEFDDMIGLPVNNMMPQMYQSMLNSLYSDKLSNIAKNVKGQLQRAFTRTSDDTQFEPEDEMRHFKEDNRVISYLGSRYTKRLHNPEFISTDILGSMIGYAQMTYEFKEKMQKLDTFELLAQKTKDTKFIDPKTKNVTSGDASNAFKRLQNHFEAHLMEKAEDPIERRIPGTNINVNLNKVLSKFNKWIQHSNLALSSITQLANIATSRINLLLENILGEHTTIKSNTFAHKEVYKLYTSETIKDIGRTRKTNKLDLMLRYFGLSESADALFNDLDKNIMMRKPVGTIAYAGYELGSYYINSILLISILKNNRIYNGKLYTEQNFKNENATVSFDSLISAYDLISVKDGKLEHKGLTSSEINLLVNKIRDLSKKVDSKLTREDYAMAHSNIIGMSALIHRNWIIDGVFRRVKAKGLNFKTGEVDEGYWRSTWEVLRKAYYNPEKIKMLMNLRTNYKKLSKEQRLGLNRTLLDLASISAMIVIAGFIFNGEDDDDEDSQFLAYLSNRILLETTSFYNPYEIIYAITDPLVSARQLETLMQLGNAVDFTEIERGKWEGYTRSDRYWLSLIPGVKGFMQGQDTKASNQFLKNKQLTWLY